MPCLFRGWYEMGSHRRLSEGIEAPQKPPDIREIGLQNSLDFRKIGLQNSLDFREIGLKNSQTLGYF